MATVGIIIGGAIINALAFIGSNFLFSTLSKKSIDKKRKKHDKAEESFTLMKIFYFLQDLKNILFH